MLDTVNCLPNNPNGIRTTHTCELCGFEPKTKNKYREKQDHLVMKHFKEKIDQIFPASRPYSCPAEACSFTGKDKQALLRHYTGKHGILEKFLREALAEKGINYPQGEHGSKRRASTSGEGGNLRGSPKISKQVRLSCSQGSTNSNTPVLISPRPNTDELRREVQALMSSFLPQSQQIVLKLPQNTQILSVPLSKAANSSNVQIEEHKENNFNCSSQVVVSQSMPIKVELPQNPNPLPYVTMCQPFSMPLNVFSGQFSMASTTPQTMIMPTSNGSMIFTSSQPSLGTQFFQGTTIMTTAPSLMMPQVSTFQLPMEMISTGTSPSIVVSSVPPTNSNITGTTANGSSFTHDGTAGDNDEVMWGGDLGPAVVVEDTNAVPITYIETVDGSYEAAMDAIDYDLLMNGAYRGDGVRERQLDFCML